MPNWSIRLFFLFVVLLHGLTIAAQRPHMKHYGVGDGLASSTVYGAYQDRHGYMWFATESGVNRFDGTEFETFTTADGLPSNTAFSFAEDNTGRLWVSCNNSRPAYFDGRRWVVDTVLIKPDETAGIRRNLNFHKHGDSLYFNFGGWFAILHENTTTNGLIEFDSIFVTKSQLKKAPIPNLPSLAFEIQVTNENSLYFHSTRASYLYKNGKSKIIKNLNNYSDKIRISGNFFYKSTENRIEKFRLEKNNAHLISSFIFDYEIGNYFVSQDSFIWVDKKNSGISLYKAHKDNNLELIYNIHEFFGLSNLYTDIEGSFWLTTTTQGMLKIGNLQTITLNQSNRSNSFFSFDTIENSLIVAGNSNGELLYYERNSIKKPLKSKSLNSNRVLNLNYEANKNMLWVASDKGTFTINQSGTIYQFNNSVAKTLLITGNDIYIGLWASLEKFNRFKNTQYSKSKKLIKVYSILENGNNLYVGAMHGLEIWGPNDTIALHNIYPDLLASRITALQLDKTGSVWVGTHNNGLVILENDSVLVKNITIKDGLTSNQVQNLRYDGRGFFWACTNKGLSKIDEHTFEVVATYDDQTTLPNNDVNDCLPFGDTIWVATADGLARFQDRVNKTPDNFRTILKSLYTLDSIYKATDETILIPQHQNDLKLTFAGLTFRSNGKLSYEYQVNRLLPSIWQWTLEDIKTAFMRFWGTTTPELTGKVSSNQLNINNLTSGKYLFTVTAMSFDGVKSRQPANLTFQILPNWTDLFLFYVALLITIIYLLYRIYSWRQNLLRNELQLKEQLGSLQFEAFKTRINPHFVFNSINGVQQFFFPPEPKKANTYISLLSTLLRKTMYMSDVNFVALKDELLYISDFLAMAKLRLGHAMEYHIDLAENLDDRIEIPAMILQPLLENAIIHGAKDGLTQVHLNISVTDHVLSCIVEDQGHGIFKKTKQFPTVTQHKSKGLALIRQRIEALNSVFKTRIELEILDKSSVSHQTQTGTKVTLKIDLKHARKEK